MEYVFILQSFDVAVFFAFIFKFYFTWYHECCLQWFGVCVQHEMVFII